MQVADVRRKTNGRIWLRKLTPTADGCLLSIIHTVNEKTVANGSSIRFLRCAFNATGEKFVAGDHQGNLYLFDLHLNRFSLIHKTSFSCTAMAFQLHHGDELLVALSDNSLRCYNTISKDLVSVMRGHQTAINHISIHSTGRYAVSSSNDTAILWNLDTFARKRTLNGAQHVGIQKVFFLPSSNSMMSCFKDGSVFAWDCDSMTCLYQLDVPNGSTSPYRSLSVSHDANMMAAAPRSRLLHLWNLHSKQLAQAIQLPDKIKEVKSVEFISHSPDKQIVAVLSQDGYMRLINLTSLKVEYEVGGLSKRVSNMIFNKDGKYFLLIYDDGSIGVYELKHAKKSSNNGSIPLFNIIDNDKSTTNKPLSTQTLSKSNNDKLRPHVTWHESQETEEATKPLPNNLNMTRLMRILKGYGEYPDKYRHLIWRSILRLPENHVSFSALIDKGTHPSYENIQEKYPIKSRRLSRVMQRVLSAFAHWSPIFGQLDYLPLIVFPFVKLFENNQLVCFEIVATVMSNWCQKWFEFYPNPPLTILGIVETLLGYHDQPLLDHFVKCNITAQIYAWPFLQTLFSEVFIKSDWLRLWDNLFSKHPSLFLFAVCAYLITSRRCLMATKKPSDFQFFFHHQNPVDVSIVIKEMFRLYDATADSIHPRNTLHDAIPLTIGQYPIFDKYPKLVADYLIQEREKIRLEEMEYLREKQVALDFQMQSKKTRLQEEAFFRQHEVMVEAEKERKVMIAAEELKLTDQRKRLQAMRREVALREINLLDEVNGKFMDHQHNLKQNELEKLDKDLQHKISLREKETKDALEDAEIKSLELQAKKMAYQQELLRKEMLSKFESQITQSSIERDDETDEARLRLMTNKTPLAVNDILQQQHKLGSLNVELANESFQQEVDKRNELLHLDQQIREMQIRRQLLENENKENDMKHALAAAVTQKEEQLKHQTVSKGIMVQRESIDKSELKLMKSVRDLRKKLSKKSNNSR